MDMKHQTQWSNMKKILIAILLVLIPVNVYAGSCYYDGSGSSTGTAPWYVRDSDHAESANSAKQEDVYYCVNTVAAQGDTVYVGAGTETWTTEYNHPENGNYKTLLPITKSIHLIGGSGGTTTITNGGTTATATIIMIHNADYTTSQTFEISNFTFDAVDRMTLRTGPASDIGTAADYNIQTVLIHDNIFTTSGDGIKGQAIWNGGVHWGVVYDNTFTDFWYPIANSFSVGGDELWDDAPQNTNTPGSEYALYYEDNTFSLISATDNMLMNGEYSPRYVFRYNDITNAAYTSGLLDFHGEQSAMAAGFFVEVYGNDYSSSSASAETFLKQRSGTSFVFFNTSSTTNSMKNTAYTSTACICPTTHVADKVTHGSYWWNNRADLNGSLWSNTATGGLDCNSLTEIPTLGRDIMDDDSSPLDCLMGSELPGTCTVGDGYWVTAQSTTTLAGMVGVDPTTPISGILYTCTETDTWTEYYTPYTYPHPLRGEGEGEASGSIIPGGCTESEIISGGKTIVITLSGDEWVADGATFEAQRQNIINGVDSGGEEAGGWDAVVKAELAVTAVVRTNATTVTITLPDFDGDPNTAYAITANETVTVTIPATAVVGAVEIVATPTFQISAELAAPENLSIVYDATGPAMVYDATGPAIVGQ